MTEEELLHELVAHGHLFPTAVPGVFGRGLAFEQIALGFDRLVTEAAIADGATFVRYPPVIPRKDFEHSEFLKSFPHLAGAVFSFEGDGQAHAAMLDSIDQGRDYQTYLKPTDVVLTPAACYPVYPSCRGRLPEEGRLFDVFSYCFRNEPSKDPARMQSFRMREHVRLGDPTVVMAFRDRWIQRAFQILERVGLEAVAEPANDPFFGRGGKLLATSQREQKLKFEMLYPIGYADKKTAIMSFNYHQEHFGQLFGIRTAEGEAAHTACVGFGLERITLALLTTHGFDVAAWPNAVRSRLFS